MRKFAQSVVLCMCSLFMISAFAAKRPTIQFNGETYYLARYYYEVDNSFSPVNVIEFYLLEGETSDNFSKSIERNTYLTVENFKASMKSRLSEFKEDNPNVPYEEIVENNKAILNVSFWWRFRNNQVRKQVYVFQMDKKINRVMCYIVTELEFFDPNKMTDDDLRKKGKSLLLSNDVVKAAKQLDF